MVGCWSWLAALDEQTGWAAAAAVVKTPHMGGGAHTCCHTMKKSNVYSGAMLWLHWGILGGGLVLTCLCSNLHIQVK